jgi:hypothetical protein
MLVHAPVASARGFVRAGPHLWLIGDRDGFRVEEDALVPVPWLGQADRPHRLVTGDALWAFTMYQHPVPCRGPSLEPEPLEAPPEPVARHLFHAADGVAAWVADRGRCLGVDRTDARHTGVPRDLIRSETFPTFNLLDLAPLPDATALLFDGHVLLVSDGRPSRRIELPPDRAARIVLSRAGRLWVAAGGTTFRIAGGAVEETVDGVLECAGDAFVAREDRRLRIVGHEGFGAHNALRDGLHAWVEGEAMWVARENGVERVSARPRTFHRDAPSFPRVERLAQVGEVLVALTAAHGRFAVDVLDGGWRRGRVQRGEIVDAVADGGALWIACRDRLLRAEPGREPERVKLPAPPWLVASRGGRVAVAAEEGLYHRGPGEGSWSFAAYAKPPAALDLREDRVLCVFDDHAAVWRGQWWKLDFAYSGSWLRRGIWGVREDELLAWDGTGRLRAWSPPQRLDWAAPDGADPDALWWSSRDSIFRADTVTGEVRRVLRTPSLHYSGESPELGLSFLRVGRMPVGAARGTALRDAAGDFWIPVHGGIAQVPAAETEPAGRLAPLPDLRLSLSPA